MSALRALAVTCALALTVAAQPPQANVRTAPPAAALAALREKLVHVEPIAAGSDLLWIDFAAAAAATSDADVAALLAPLRAHVAELSLARCRIGDAALVTLGAMPALERANLARTAVTTHGLEALRGLAKLHTLILTATKLDDGAVEPLLAMPALANVWLWESGVSAKAIARLRAARPDLRVEVGAMTATDVLEVEPEVQIAAKDTAKDTAKAGAAAKPAAVEPATAAPPPVLHAKATSDGTLAPVNATCPVSGKPVDPRYAIVFEGRVIGLCCPHCAARFWQDPDAYRSKIR